MTSPIERLKLKEEAPGDIGRCFFQDDIYKAWPEIAAVIEAATITANSIAAAYPPHPDIGGIRALRDALEALAKKDKEIL